MPAANKSNSRTSVPSLDRRIWSVLTSQQQVSAEGGALAEKKYPRWAVFSNPDGAMGPHGREMQPV
jgi:hypothetical protein